MPHDATTALLVIDIQNGAFDGVRCPPMDAPQRLLDAAGQLLAAARAAGRPVVFVQHGEGAGEPFEAGTEHAALHPALAVRPGEHVEGKRACSAFEATGLDAHLRRLGVDTLVVCGLQSEHCVSHTTRAALQHGYRVHLAQDGHGTWTWGGRPAAQIVAEVNAQLAAAGATLAPTAELAAALRGSA